MNLTSIRNLIIKQKYFAIAILIVFLIIFALVLTSKSKPKDKYLPVTQQPTVNDQFNENAAVSKTAKAEVDSLLKKLPYTQTIKTKTEKNITYQIYKRDADAYTIYIQIKGVNFRSDYTDPNLPENVQDFRDTASSVLGWISKQGVETEKIFIIWGDKAYVQENAEKWLNISPQFPNVVKREGSFVFESEPVK